VTPPAIFPAMAHPLSLAQAPVGTRIEQEFLVRDRTEKVTRTGNPFVVLTLAGTLWSGAFVAFLAGYAQVLLAPRVDGKPG